MSIDIYHNGFTDLVSIIPPNAEIAPGSTIKLSSRGKVPGLQRRDNLWVGYRWTETPVPSAEEVMKWLRQGANLGLKADRFPGLDIDVDNPQLAKLVQQEAIKFLGPGPVRTSREDRRLIVYRTGEPFKRISAKINYKGREHLVECLGTGLQYLVHGRHPAGVDYGWSGKSLDKWKPEQLTEIDSSKVIAFFAHLREVLEGRATVEVRVDMVREKKEIPPQDELRAPDLDALAALVESIPNDGAYDSRDDYILFGIAVKAAGGDAALYIFQEWCSRWEGGENTPEEVEQDWRRMHPPFTVGWDWLVQQSGDAGYRQAQEEFEADADAVPPVPVEKDDMLAGVVECSDTWVVEKLASVLRKQLRFVPETGNWHIWEGHAWVRDRRNLAEHLVRRALVRLSAVIYEQAKGVANEETQKKFFRFASSLQSRGALTKVVPELQAHPRITLLLSQFDANPWELNTPGGIVDLRTGLVSPPDPGRLHSRSTAIAPTAGPDGVVWDPSLAPLWSAFLDEATGGDKDLQRFLQKQIGYSLTASTQEQTLIFIHGPPLTGKSVFIEAVGGLVGSYHENAPSETFSLARGDRHPADLAKLAGARLVTSVETQEGRAWDTQRVKSLTGGDMISARFMRQDFFDFRPTFKIMIVGNHAPEIRGVDEAMMRRLRVVPFEHSPKAINRLLGTELKAEWSHILAWAVQGCLLWVKEGLAPPEAVQVKTSEYSEDENLLAAFTREKLDFVEDELISRQELYEAWTSWCYRQGEEPGTLKGLTRRFRTVEREEGLEDVRFRRNGNQVRGYKGVKLLDEGVL